MRRDRRVIKLSRVCISDNAWQLLAETAHPAGEKTVNVCGRLSPAERNRTSGFLVKDRGRPLARPAAEAAQHCQRQEAEAAHRGVKQQSHPGWYRQNEGAGCDQKANHGGQDNLTCEHVLQPPREEHLQRASIAWQEYGRPWVNLRRVNRDAVGRKRALQPTSPSATTGSILPGSAQLRVANRRRCQRCIRKYMMANNKIQASGPAISPAICREAWVGMGLTPPAAIWHKPGRPEMRHTPEVTDDCLSFVIPDQQGARVAAIEDVL